MRPSALERLDEARAVPDLARELARGEPVERDGRWRIGVRELGEAPPREAVEHGRPQRRAGG